MLNFTKQSKCEALAFRHPERVKRPKDLKTTDSSLPLRMTECAGLCKVRNDNRIFAFTLAEVLITLVIIGVVAALTIPNLMKNYQTHIFKTAYKQAYSDINQAFAQAFKDGELIRTSRAQNNAATQEWNILKQNLKVTKECKANDLYSCWAQGDTVCGGSCSSGQRDENGQEIFDEGYPRINSFGGFIDAAGRSWSMYPSHNIFFVDINGPKVPNQFGKDRFVFVPRDSHNNWTTSYTTNQPVRFGPIYPKNYTTKNSYCKFPPCYYYDWLYK